MFSFQDLFLIYASLDFESLVLDLKGNSELKDDMTPAGSVLTYPQSMKETFQNEKDSLWSVFVRS